MPSSPEKPCRCPLTGILHRWNLPGGASPAAAVAPSAVFFLNGIGLDLEGFWEAIQTLDKAPANYPYWHGYHVALTVPGFENGKDRIPDSSFSMAEQGKQVAAFMAHFLAEHPAQEVILYGFSFGSDLSVEVLASLEASWPLVRVVLAEMNVHANSCFITSRITASFHAATSRGLARNQEAHKGFVSRVVKASSEGRLSATLMQDMAMYFRTIARKDWAQLAKSAAEVSADPEHRVARLLGITADRPDTCFDLVFSDPLDLRILRRRIETWGGRLGQIRIFDATAHEHFHHMSRMGILENLGGWLQDIGPDPTHPLARESPHPSGGA